MQDERDYLTRVRSMIESMDGKPVSNDEMLSAFAGLDPRQRAEGLDAFDGYMASDSGGSLRRKAEMLNMRRRMGDIHTALRRADR